MNKKRKFWGAIAALAALYAVRMALKMAEDLRRYNHILSLSNEGTVQQEMPELAMQVMKHEKQTVKEWMNFMKSAPKDLARYLKIESM
jgi:thymidylate synthase ThyX